jgi:hypothetical protein
MSNQQRDDSGKPGGRRGDHDPRAAQPPTGSETARPASGTDEQAHAHEALRRNRLDTIELADDHTEQMNPHRGSSDDALDSVGEMLEGRESNAHYRREARRVTPTIGPDEDRTTS